MSMNISITLNEWLWICFSFSFNYQPLLSTSKASIYQNLWTLPHSANMKSLWPHRHTSCSCNISRKHLSSLGEDKKLTCREKTWQTEMDGDRFLSCQHLCSEPSLLFFCISINCFSARCYLGVLLACREAMCSSLGRPSAHLLTQFVWHYCPSLDAMGSWQTQVYDVHIKTE